MRIQAIIQALPTAALLAATAAALAVNSPIAHALAPVFLLAAILWRGQRRRLVRGAYSAAARKDVPSISSV